MPATQIFTEAITGPYVQVPLSASTLDLSWTAADPVNGNFFIADVNSGEGDILLVWNKDTAAHNLTITSQIDTPFQRKGDISSYSIAAGVISAFNFQSGIGGEPANAVVGWTDSGSNIFIAADNALVFFAVVTR